MREREREEDSGERREADGFVYGCVFSPYGDINEVGNPMLTAKLYASAFFHRMMQPITLERSSLRSW